MNNAPTKMLTLTADVDLEALNALNVYLASTNNGYARKEYLTKAMRGQIAHLVELGMAVETWSHVFTPKGYACRGN